MSLDNVVQRPVGRVGWDEAEDVPPAPLTAEQAQDLLRRQPVVSPWWVVRWQVIVGALVGLVLALIWGRWSLAWSGWYGAMAVALPSALLVRGMRHRAWQQGAAASLMGFYLWEAIKVGLTLALLALGPRLVKDLSWPAMLAGLLVTMQVYLLALRGQRGGKAT